MMRQIDLLPESYAEKRRERRNFVGLFGAGLVLLLGLGLWWFMLGNQVSDTEAELESVQAQNNELSDQIAQLQRFADLEAEVQAKEEALNTVMTGDIAWPSLLTEVAMVIPGEVWLVNLTSSAGATEGAAPVGTETAPIRVSQELQAGRISFSGKSLSMPGISKWLIRLEGSKTFSAAWLESATEVEGADGVPPIIEFTSTLELNQKALSGRFLEGAR
jgi:Tfp pilus assembly protein PilN